jgi:hypothetical protein
MSAMQTAAPPAPKPHPEHLAHEIGVDCHRALRRLDRLDSERYDVVLAHARQLIRHAAALSRAIERHQHA